MGEESTTEASGCGCGCLQFTFFMVFGLAFLKILNVHPVSDWSWWLVTLPIWAAPAFTLAIASFVLAFVALAFLVAFVALLAVGIYSTFKD